MSINRAQATAIADGFLDSLGTAPPDGELPVIDAVLAEAAHSLIDAAVANLDQSASVSSGELATALTFSVDILGDTYEMSVGYEKGSKAAAYWDFVNQGVQGVAGGGKAPKSPYKFKTIRPSKAHVLAIMQWLRRNGKAATNISAKHPVSGLEKKRVTLRESVSSVDSVKSLAYAIATSIKRDGLKPTNYFDNAVAANLGTELTDALAVALAGEIRLRIRKTNDPA